jgi:plastin-1
MHTYSEEEAAAFSRAINASLSLTEEEALSSENLFDRLSDGLILCRMVNAAVPDTLDERALNWPPGKGPGGGNGHASPQRKALTGGRGLNTFQQSENINAALASARSIGISVVNVHGSDILSMSFSSAVTGGRGGKQHLVLGLAWQLIRAQLLSHLTLKEHPELSRLCNEGESLRQFMDLGPEAIILRWVNYHLRKDLATFVISNLSSDVSDGFAYFHLLHSLGPAELASAGMGTVADARKSTAEGRAEACINAARALGAPTITTPADLCSGNKKLNLAFTAALFNSCPGLVPVEASTYEAASLFGEDEGDAREARQYKAWLNSMSLGPEEAPIVISSLYPSLTSGLLLLFAIDRISPGTVDWHRVNTDPGKMNKFQAVENCNYVVSLSRSLGFSLVGMGGVDIHAGTVKLCLGLLWQLLRYHLLKVLGGLGLKGSGEGAATEADILAWANDRVAHAALLPGRTARPAPLSSFRDPALASGLYLLTLLASCEPRAINPALVADGETGVDKLANARYVLGVARKIGVLCFVTHEDITEAKPKAMTQFLCSIMARAQEMEKGVGPGGTPSTSRHGGSQ